MSRRLISRGFTLAEVMIAILIFSVVSGAMLGIFTTATTLYQRGQAAQTADDQATASLSLLRRDLDQAIDPLGKGAFYTWLQNDGSCLVGWVIPNPEPPERADPDRYFPEQLVLWGHDSQDRLRRSQHNWPDEHLLRDLLEPETVSDNRFFPSNDRSQTIADGCLHFGVWLSGTGARGSNELALHPDVGIRDDPSPRERSSWWYYMVLPDGDAPTQPSVGARFYQTFAPDQEGQLLRYPSAIRFSLILDASQSDSGRLLGFRDTADGALLRVRGLRGLVAQPGSLLRIGKDKDSYEWVGVFDSNTAGLLINREWADGPVVGNSGRLALRSRADVPDVTQPPEHEPGVSEVRSGRWFTLSYQFGL